MSADYEHAVRSWAEHLRRGGTTRWTQWRALVAAGTTASVPAPRREVLPGAAQLELVRRLAAAATPPGDGFSRLADLVLDRSAPGRGGPDRPLPWPGGPPPGYGPLPIDPADVSDRELLRLAVGTLVDLALDDAATRLDHPRPSGSRVRRVLARRRSGFRLAGAPVTVAAVRRELAAEGHLERGRAGDVHDVVLLGEPLDALLAQVWSARVQHGAAVRWRGFLHRWSGRSALPGSADLGAAARHWAAQVGSDRVHVVPGAGAAAVADVLGLSGAGRLRADVDAGAGGLSPAGTDVVRRVNGVLSVRVDRDRHSAVVPRVVAAVGSADRSAGSLTVPPGLRDWARTQGERLAEELAAGGYRVHGDLEQLLPAFEGPSRPRPREALEVAVAACLTESAAREPEGGA